VKSTKNLSPNEREFFSKKEYNKYVDDAYLLMGKSHFYKHEYPQAEEIFRMILNDYKNQPVTYETQVWLGRVMIETGQHKDAYETLNVLLNNAEFPKNLQQELFPTMAAYYLTQRDYARTIEFLGKSLELERHKKTRARYTYILAQLYEKTGDLKQASDFYEKVIQMNPVYDMAFNARINRAMAFQQGFGNVEEIESELKKMIRDDKNQEYLDQIYYAWGNLSAKNGDNAKALEYYRKSVDANVNNEQQKTRSYLTIANLYYAIPDYPHAQAYYDSALTQLEPDYVGYNALVTKSESLTRLVKEMNTVELEDSVLLLAKLPPAELNARIDALIESEREKEEAERQKQQEAQLDQQFGNEVAVQNVSRIQNNADGTRWYFYNETTKSQGYREFKLTWGNRKLEDHWQRSNKSVSVFAAGATEEVLQDIDEPDAPEATFSKLSREFYMANIPRTDSAVKASNSRIEQGLYNMGIIYRTDLKDFDKASVAFKEMIQRFPRSEYLLSAYFNLYTMAREQSNQALTDYYKNIIAGQFPESMYAKVLTNPEYIAEMEAETRRIHDYYAQTYDFYKNGNFSEVIQRSQYALKNFSNSGLIPRFAYLGVLSAGKDTDRKIFRENLLAFTATYPGTEVATDAQSLIEYMDREHPELKVAQEKILIQKLYHPAPDAEHLFAYIAGKTMNTNQLVFNIINFNLDNFDKWNLRVEIVPLNATQNLVIVKTFSNKADVMQYLKIIRTSDAIQKDITGMTVIPIAISAENLNTLKEDKAVERYQAFFNENYMQ
jgi:tetratricopeptide (TPR) repeat protein